MFLLALVAGVILASAVAAAVGKPDQGSDRPPGTLTSDKKSIWMTEWVACWRVTMGHLSTVLHIPVKSGATPQQAANRLSLRAVRFLYETQPELDAAAAGCRSGILWRYYHPDKA